MNAAAAAPPEHVALDDIDAVEGLSEEPKEELKEVSNKTSGMEGVQHLRYTVTDTPPWYQCVLLGFQHSLTMLGSTVLIPLLLVPAVSTGPYLLALIV